MTFSDIARGFNSWTIQTKGASSTIRACAATLDHPVIVDDRYGSIDIDEVLRRFSMP